MRKNLLLGLLAILAGSPLAAHAEDARSILETARDKQLQRWQGVDSYVVNRSVMGQSIPTHYVRTIVDDGNGNEQILFMQTSVNGSPVGSCAGPQKMTPEQLEVYAAASEMTGDLMASEIEDGLEEAGLPRGLLAASGSDPTATFDPRVIMGGNAAFLRGAANAERQLGEEDSVDATMQAENMSQFIDSAKLVGEDSFDGRKAYHLKVDDVEMVQESDGQTYEITSVSMWIDKTEYVPLRTLVEGVMTSGSESRPIAIESLQSDYRAVPGSNMYESFRQVTKIAGVMDAEQQAQLKEAQQQMAEFEKQMASMPASQRKMMESMMGPQMEQMRKMAAGDGFESEIITSSIEVNPGRAADGKPCP